MLQIELRPNLTAYSNMSPTLLVETISEKIKTNNKGLQGTSMQDHFTIWINKKDRHYWSPQFSALITAENDNTSRISGFFGPMPTVWTLFAFMYIGLSVLITFITIIGFAQRSLNQDSSILWFVPLLVGIMILLYFSSIAGRKLARPQIELIHSFLTNEIGIQENKKHSIF